MTAELKNPHACMTQWKPSAELLPDGLTFSDIDGIIERKGQFLVVETKHESEQLGRGQAIMLAELSKLPNFNVFVVLMPDKAQGIVEKFYIINDGQHGDIHYGHDKWCQVVKRWWDKVNG